MASHHTDISQFRTKDRHKAYRDKIQRYAREEKNLWEDLRHGLTMGSKKFVDKIRNQYLPGNLHTEIPQQRELAKTFDHESRLKQAAQSLGCDFDQFKRMLRNTKSESDDRNIVVLSAWKLDC